MKLAEVPCVISALACRVIGDGPFAGYSLFRGKHKFHATATV